MEPLRSTASAARGRRPRLLGLALALAALVPLIAACEVAVQPPPGAEPFEITGLSVTSSYTGPDGKAAICDTETTEITYRLRYDGVIDTVTSRFVGDGEVWGTRHRRRDGEDEGLVVYSYEVPPGSVPLDSSAVAPQAITVRGTTVLEVVGRGLHGGEDRAQVRIGVYTDC